MAVQYFNPFFRVEIESAAVVIFKDVPFNLYPMQTNFITYAFALLTFIAIFFYHIY